MFFYLCSVVFFSLLIIVLLATGAIGLPTGIIAATLYCFSALLVSPSENLSKAKPAMKTAITVTLCVAILMSTVYFILRDSQIMKRLQGIEVTTETTALERYHDAANAQERGQGSTPPKAD